MDRDLMIQAVEAAMDNVHDMDTPWSTYAAAAVDALGWRTFETDPPERGDFIMATNMRARWVDKYASPDVPSRFGEHVATHWHPVHDLTPARHSQGGGQ